MWLVTCCGLLGGWGRFRCCAAAEKRTLSGPDIWCSWSTFLCRVLFYYLVCIGTFLNCRLCFLRGGWHRVTLYHAFLDRVLRYVGCSFRLSLVFFKVLYFSKDDIYTRLLPYHWCGVFLIFFYRSLRGGWHRVSLPHALLDRILWHIGCFPRLCIVFKGFIFPMIFTPCCFSKQRLGVLLGCRIYWCYFTEFPLFFTSP